MEVRFDPEVARRVGIDSAVAHEWVLSRVSRGGESVTEAGGRRWLRCPVALVTEELPWLSTGQARQALRRLVDAGFLDRANLDGMSKSARYYAVAKLARNGKVMSYMGTFRNGDDAGDGR